MTEHVGSFGRTITQRQLFAYMFGTIIGVGWITASGAWIVQAGSLGAIIAFGGGALVMIVIGASFAELAAMMPDSAGATAFGARAFGRVGAFLVGWLLIMAYFVFTAFYVLSIAWLIEAAGFDLSGTELYRVSGEPVFAGTLVAGVSVAAVVTALNLIGVSASARFQDLLVWLKVALGTLLFVVALAKGATPNVAPLFVGGDATAQSLAVFAVMATTPVWFSGFDVLPQMMRERSRSTPAKAIGWVMAAGIVAALLFYTAIIIATALLLPPAAREASNVPTFEAFSVGAGSSLLGLIVLLAGVLGILTAWNATTFAGSRIVVAMARLGYLPRFFGAISSKTGTPTWAVAALGMSSAPFALLGRGGADAVIAASGFGFLLVFLVVCVAAAKLRITEPNVERPIRFHWIVNWLGAFLSLALIAIAGLDSLRNAHDRLPIEWVLLIVWSAIGLVILVSSEMRKTDRQSEEALWERPS